MRPVTLKGTQSGYELRLASSASFYEINSSLRTLLDRLDRNRQRSRPVAFKILTGNRLFNDEETKRVKRVFTRFPNFSISKIISNVMTIADSYRIKERDNVHTVDVTIRNGQDYHLHGDVLFLGDLHQGGRLSTDGNIYVMGNVEGIVHAGFPSNERKLIVGDLHNAQQVRIGEQFDVVADRQIPVSSRVVAYVNDLHVLQYSRIVNLKRINPEFYNHIGGMI